jgi:ethanolamine ammonia-lyase small subunit
MMMEEEKINQIVELVLRQLQEEGLVPGGLKNQPGEPTTSQETITASAGPVFHPDAALSTHAEIEIDLPDPAGDNLRWLPRVKNAKDPEALIELMASTSARIGVGRAGPRSNTASLLLFQADHAITQDALYRDVDQRLLDEFNLMTVQTRITEGREEYLLRPDLGRQLSDAARQMITEKCQKNPDLQLVVGDGLSALAIESNLRQIFPVIVQGAQSAGLRMGTPFYVKYCRVGVMNDIGDILQPKVLILLIGERPGLGRAESMSAYMAYQPGAGQNDANRDVVCNIFEKGGTNPLEAGAFIVQFAQKMMQYQASGVKLKLAAG